MHEIDATMYDCINVVLDIFRIGSYDRTIVVVIRICEFVSLKRNTRVKDMFYSLIDQPLYMTVSKFCRITLGFAWNGVYSELINLSCRSRREQNRESQSMEKGKPKWIVLIHIKNARNTDNASFCFFRFQWFIAKVTFQFIIE